MTLGETFPLLRDGTLFDWGNKLVQRSAQGQHAVVPTQAMATLTEGLIPVGWAGAFGCVALLSAMILAAIITPTLELHGRARRARPGMGSSRPPWASDAQSALVWTAALGLMALAGWSILVGALLDTPLLRMVLHPSRELPIVLGAGLLIPLLTWAILLEWRGIKVACLGAVVLWIIPLMVGVIGMLSGTDPLHWPKWCLGLSGFALPFYSMSQSVTGLVDLSSVVREMRGPWLMSLIIHAVLGTGMYVFLRKAQRGDLA